MTAIQTLTRGEIRRSVGKNLGILIDGVATAASADKSSLEDTKNLLGGDDEHNQKEVMIYETTDEAAPQDESSIVDNFTSSSNIATCIPIFTAEITTSDKYEMWKTPWRITDINDAINQAIIEITNRALVDRQTDSNFSRSNEYIYDWLVPYAFGNDFKLLYKVEYVKAVGIGHDIHLCEAAWDEYVLPTYVTVSLDTTYEVEGNYCLKLVVTDGYSAADILATDSLSSLDISDCDEVEITIRSNKALAAGDLQLLLDDHANCASPTESLDIPATLANTTTTHIIDLANPHLDTAIISVGIKAVTDKDAITLYLDRIKAVNSASKQYKELSPEYWSIVKGTTPKLALASAGLSVVGTNTQVRLTGFSAPDIFSDDSTDSEVDPAYLIAQTTGRLLISHAKSSFLDIHNRQSLSQYWLAQAASMLPSLTPSLPGTTRSI